ncbi:MAG: alpha/beta hydrolase [Gemmatimonadetes bacterium]|nr:alpha/beta hydrolase [Gemmatimonadota bacterium]
MTAALPLVLTVPGWTGSGPGHWQTLWERAEPRRVRRVEQRDWDAPRLDDWIRALDAAIAAEPASVVLAAHSLGCIAVAHWAANSTRAIAGALLVAPADVERPDAPGAIRGFAPVPLRPLPFRSVLVASSDDEYLAMDRAAHFARCWGSELVPIGAAGHVNTAAGFGRWPEGERLLRALRGES